jgi:hypothetical protein
LTLRVANYDNGPVQIVGLKHAEEAGKEPYVHLRNTSSVKTSRIWVQAEIRDLNDPTKPTSRTNSNTPNQLWSAERLIEPGSDVWARETVLRSDSIASDAKELHARCVSVTISVLSVDFVDGTSWTPGVNGADKSLKYSDDRSRNEDSCKNAAPTKTGAHELAGAMIWRIPHPEKFINWLDDNSYSISCPVMLDQGKYFAACPF